MSSSHKARLVRKDRRLFRSFLWGQRRQSARFLTQVSKNAVGRSGGKTDWVGGHFRSGAGQFVTNHPSTGGKRHKADADSDLGTDAH